MKTFYLHFLDRSFSFTNMIGVQKHHCASFRGQRRNVPPLPAVSSLNGRVWVPRVHCGVEHRLRGSCCSSSRPKAPVAHGHDFLVILLIAHCTSGHISTHGDCLQGEAHVHTHARTCTPQRTKKPITIFMIPFATAADADVSAVPVTHVSR